MSKTTLTWGTGYFKSLKKAVDYYERMENPGRCNHCSSPADLDYVKDIVQEKIKQGEIHIGKPPNSPGVIKCYADKDGRYHLIVPYPSPVKSPDK
jgi:hypothetical protein